MIMTSMNLPTQQVSATETDLYENGFGKNADGTIDYSVYEKPVLNDNGTPDTADDYYEIRNAGQLYYFVGLVNGDSKVCDYNADTNTDGTQQNTAANARLMNDITINTGVLTEDGELNATDKSSFLEWTPIGMGSYQYAGTFDGANHSIRGLYCVPICDYYAGLFGITAEESVIQDLTVADSYISNRERIGAICGENYGSIDNCQSSARVEVVNWDSNAYAGGICGYDTSGRISNCKNYGAVTVTLTSNNCNIPDVGGICGFGERDWITECMNAGTVSAGGNSSNRVGGIGGRIENASKFVDCHNMGMISGSENIGGIVGATTSNIENCYNTGEVRGFSSKNSGYVFVGGLAGWHAGGTNIYMKKSYSIGTLSAAATESGVTICMGGVAGLANITIADCYYLEDTADTAIAHNSSEQVTNVSAKDVNAFVDGEVAFLLSDGVTDSVWGQRINGKNADTHPVFAPCYQVVRCEEGYDNVLNHQLSLDTESNMYRCSVCGATAPKDFLQGTQGKDNYYKSDVTIGADGWLVSVDKADWKETISVTEEGKHSYTLYFKDENENITDVENVDIHIDKTSPTGTIQMQGGKWDAFQETGSDSVVLTQENISITAEDSGSGVASVDYIISEILYDTLSAVQSLTEWTAYNPGKETGIAADTPSYVYAKITDMAGNVTYLSSTCVLYDTIAPTVDSVCIDEMESETGKVRVCGTDAGSGIKGYYFLFDEEEQTANAYTATELKQNGTFQKDSTFALTGLTPDTEYYYAVLALDEARNASEVYRGSFRTAKVKLTGSVTIQGVAEYGSTLEASYEGLPADAQNVTLSWYRGDSDVAIATTNTYAVTADDIGSVITVKVTAENYGGSINAVTKETERADAVPDEVTGLTATYGEKLSSVTITTENGTWTWVDEPDKTYVGAVGKNTFEALFTPKDQTCYKPVVTTVTITVAEAKTNLPTDGNGTANGNDTSNGNGTLNGNGNSDDASKLPVKGSVITDDQKTGQYQILNLPAKEVTFKGLANKNAKSVTIPATVKIKGVTCKVTGIADNAMKGSKKLTKAVIGSNVKTIGKNAFAGSKKLKTVKIG
ncbi:MAG: GLUG motif-containing protein, partial [Butyribacter sp.]|nr:GLUG motif-containing protein [Butyribacter sp.]